MEADVGAASSPERQNGQDRRPRVVVVGNGMTGYKVCERIRQLDTARSLRLVTFADEPRPAYDRVQLTSYFEHQSAQQLTLASLDWYAENNIELFVGERVISIDRASRVVRTSKERVLSYDHLVLATGSSAFVPPIEGIRRPGVHVYRTISDLQGILAQLPTARRCAVIGGGLLGLEAARALHDAGQETHVIEAAERLMPRQLDPTGARLLRRSIEALGVHLHLGNPPRAITDAGRGLRISMGESTSPLVVDLIVVSAGIRPRDELAREAELELGERGGIQVDDSMLTNDPHISAVGESACHRGMVYGLVGPCYEMADVVARRLVNQDDARFTGSDLSAKLKLLGVEVATVGEPLCDPDGERSVSIQDFAKGHYKKLTLSACGKYVEGAVLVGDARPYSEILRHFRAREEVGKHPEQLLLGDLPSAGPRGAAAIPDAAQICSCNNVSKGEICQSIRENAWDSVGDVKRATRAGAGCGGCVPQVTQLLEIELKARGASVKPRICEHFNYTRQELYEIVRVQGLETFDELLEKHGTGSGCELCKPVAASIFASTKNEMVLRRHATLQDTNDRFLANIQRRGLYSVVPRIPGGEITPDKLIIIGQIAKKYDLYTKITGGQRIDLFGARLSQLPFIWEELVDAGFESGHAYGKALRTVKSCVGSTWCRYGVQDSVGLAVRVEERYRGLRAPHKLKSAVSGCVRECAEAQSKDFGIIATEKGYNLYVCGNGGSHPRHADLLVADLDEPTLMRTIDRFLMYYIRTADKLNRTAVWVEKLEGGIDHVRDVVVHDSLGLGEELDAQMQALVDSYHCEWTAVVRDPALRAQFRELANAESALDATDKIQWIHERGQKRPSDWGAAATPRAPRALPVVQTTWVRACKVEEVQPDGGLAFRHGPVQIAVFKHTGTDEYYATQNMCPHMQDLVMSRGLLGDQSGEPKVACPQHKRSFSLRTGKDLSGEGYAIRTFPVRVMESSVYVELPPANLLAPELCPSHQGGADAAE